MVLFFTSIADPSYTIFAGKNKDENEVLLRWPVFFLKLCFFSTRPRTGTAGPRMCGFMWTTTRR